MQITNCQPTLETPVAMFVFNRPDVTDRVFAEVRRAQPRRLFIIGDGARGDRDGELDRVTLTRDIVSAYRESGGSMKALIISLLTSDAFLYRTRAEQASG